MPTNVSSQLYVIASAGATGEALVGIINTGNQPINNKLEEIPKEFDTKSSSLPARMEYLEAENTRQDEENGTLKRGCYDLLEEKNS